MFCEMSGSIDSLSKGELLTVLSLIVYDVKHVMVKITGYNYILNASVNCQVYRVLN